MMKAKHIVRILIPCRDAEEVQKAKEAVLYHLETLNPSFVTTADTLSVSVAPLDPALFLPEEACDIIRQTLAQSLTFNHDWTCQLVDLQAGETKTRNNMGQKMTKTFQKRRLTHGFNSVNCHITIER